MYLSELPLENIKLVRDGQFCAMALCDVQTGMYTLTYIEDIKYIPFINRNPEVTCVLCTFDIVNKLPESVIGVCISSSPKIDFFLLHNRLCSFREYAREEYETQIGVNCSISPLAHIDSKNVTIGNNVKIEEFVSIKENTCIKDNVRIRAGTVIGCDGFEFKQKENEAYFIEHAGGVIIGNNVELFANTCVCKALFPWDNTIIGDYTKVDNLVHIAHACKIGRNNIITACVSFCGSAQTKDDVFIGPNATIAKITMSENSRASLGSVVINNVKKNITVSGNFAVEHSRFLMNYSRAIAKNKSK
jgi:UDP-3-O-[3-hydroxymyristoyl] glucosamine N-acyltransferase